MSTHDSDPFGSLSAAFLSSFNSQPGAKFHPSLQLTDLRSRHAGRGIIATSTIPADTELFVIPRDFVIGVASSELARRVPSLFARDDADEAFEDAEEAMVELPKPWLDLILVMVYEFLHKDTSKWKEYWGVLPERFDTLMFWDEAELKELQASAARAKIGRDDADSMFRTKILPVVKKHESVFYSDGMKRLSDEELLTLAHRMGSLIMAYAFDLENDEELEGNDADEGQGEDGWTEDREGKMAMGMVPMADMLNADAEFNAHLEHGEKELTMRSLREIREGEEVLNYYGPLPRSDLLRRYGYTSSKHARYDVVEIEWDLIKKAMEEVLGKAFEATIDDEELEESFVLERESGDPDESGVNTTEARFTAFPEEMVEQITAFASEALQIKGNPSSEQKRRLKQMFLQTMAKALPARLKQYGSTIEQDEDLLRQSLVSGRRRMAVDVRIGEKRLLNEAQALVTELLAKYTEPQDSNPQAGPTKKRKTRR